MVIVRKNMKKSLMFAAVLILLASCTSEPKPTWSEEVDGAEIDWTTWSKIPRTNPGPAWKIHMSDYDGCFELRDGCLVLKGIVNPGLEGDDSPILTGGLWTKDKKSFGYGRLEIRAKIGEA